MFAVPVAMPVTSPVVFTEATAAASVVQVPPPTALVNVVVAPTHTVVAPAIAAGVAGAGLTVMLAISVAVPQILVIL